LSFFTALQTPVPQPELLFYFVPNTAASLHLLPFVQHMVAQAKRPHNCKRNAWKRVFSSLKQKKNSLVRVQQN